jgi:hypothetical protein
MNPCDQRIYEEGEVVFVTHTIAAKDIESWVKSVALLSGQPVDWHFVAGRAVVKALGDIDFVKDTIRQLLPEHHALMRAALLELNFITEDEIQKTCDGVASYSDL